MNEKEHKERHEQLHASLDELFADFIQQHHKHSGGFLSTPIHEIIDWSHLQTIAPTHKG